MYDELISCWVNRIQTKPSVTINFRLTHTGLMISKLYLRFNPKEIYYASQYFSTRNIIFY